MVEVNADKYKDGHITAAKFLIEKAGSVTAAANAMGVSQSSLNRFLHARLNSMENIDIRKIIAIYCNKSIEECFPEEFEKKGPTRKSADEKALINLIAELAKIETSINLTRQAIKNYDDNQEQRNRNLTDAILRLAKVWEGKK